MTLRNKMVLVLFALLVGSVTMGTPIDLPLAFALIILFGIPHGATDHALFNFITKKRASPKPQGRFIVFYLTLIGIYALLWLALPALSLLLFLLLSAYHFGETQLASFRLTAWRKWVASMSWGIVALLVLFLPHLEAVTAIISPYLVTEKHMLWVNTNGYWLLLFPLALLAIALVTFNYKLVMKELMELALLYIIASNVSLLLGFAVFFTFWHAQDAMLLQIWRIKHVDQSFNWRKWLRLSLPFTLVSILGIALITVVAKQFSLQMPVTALFFILIALITAPHVLVMAVFYTKT